jgi:hypothetical protein
VVEETDVLLEPGKLARAEELILAGLDNCKTWTDLLRLAQRAVITVDPMGAEFYGGPRSEWRPLPRVFPAQRLVLNMLLVATGVVQAVTGVSWC